MLNNYLYFSTNTKPLQREGFFCALIPSFETNLLVNPGGIQMSCARTQRSTTAEKKSLMDLPARKWEFIGTKTLR
jgi:hypothetical protein